MDRRLPNIIKAIVVVSIYLVQCPSFAQDFVVNIKGDTLEGKVKPQFFKPELVTVVSSDKKRQKFTNTQVRCFKFRGDLYKPVRRESGYSFMKLIRGGYLSLYAYQLENQTTFDGQLLVKSEGSYLEVPNLTFKKMVTRFLDDDIELVAKIADGQLGKNQLLDIVDEYNDFINAKSKAAMSSVKQHTEQKAGVSNWQSFEQSLQASPDFEKKADALEMVKDIKGKVGRSEKIPSFLSEGLKSLVPDGPLKEELTRLLSEY